ncbi:MAG: phosphoribosylglycinamide formyltransferase [Cytophagales bacterium]|nr:phosphoribosylglycinamide formyltransferase [Cytophagales bacterium]
MHQIAIFASGSGSNAQRIAEYFARHPRIRVGLILTNNPRAGVIDRARQLGIPVIVFTREQFYGSDSVVEQLRFFGVDFVVLAGFLWLVPENLIAAYPHRIVNIHPALLPAYGGKGMYGMKVHEAVVAAREKASGITIHLIDNEYDRGRIVFQAQCPVAPDDTPAEVARKVQALEHEHFPAIIERLLLES